MNPEAQRIAIAKACGWEEITSSGITTGLPRYGGQLAEEYEELPDYLTDLNAMHEAEKVLTGSQHYYYGYWIMVLVATNSGYGEVEVALYAMATAPERAEAFLRTIGKWVDSPQ